jgi:cobalt/nickel transport system permease protein
MAGMMYLRALAILSVAMAVVYSTPMMVLLRALQCLLVPRALVAIALLAYRYLFTLSWEFTRLRWALATRGFGNRGVRAGYRILANVVGVSLVRSFERTERIQQAMYCRGYTGNLHTLHRFTGRFSDQAKSIVCVLFATGLLVLDRGWFPW